MFGDVPVKENSSNNHCLSRLVKNLHRKVLIPDTGWSMHGASLKSLPRFIHLDHHIRENIFPLQTRGFDNFNPHNFDTTILANSSDLT